jgi:hypothetical protein
MVDDLFVHVDKKGESTSDPVVVFLADSNIDQLFLAEQESYFWLLLLEGQKLKNQRNTLSRLQEESIVFSNHIVAFGLCIVTT